MDDKKPDGAAPPGAGSTSAERLKWALDTVWHGNQSDMAGDLGLSQPTVSRLVAGKNAPSRRALLKAAGHPGLNGDWLLTGIGAPFVPPRPRATLGSPVPIASQPLPGNPNEYVSLLSGNSYAVAGELFASGRYFFEASVDFADVRAGDLVLIETARHVCEEPAAICGSICIVEDGDQLRVVRVASVAGNKILTEPELLSRTKPSTWPENVRRVIIRPAQNAPHPLAKTHTAQAKELVSADQDHAPVPPEDPHPKSLSASDTSTAVAAQQQLGPESSPSDDGPTLENVRGVVVLLIRRKL